MTDNHKTYAVQQRHGICKSREIYDMCQKVGIPAVMLIVEKGGEEETLALYGKDIKIVMKV